MATKEAMNASKAAAPPHFVNWGQHQTETALNLQKAILESCEQASRAWVDRVQSEISLWSDLASKLSSTKAFRRRSRHTRRVFRSGCRWPPTTDGNSLKRLNRLRKSSPNLWATADPA